MSRWSKFLALSMGDRARLVVYVTLLPVISLAMKVYGFQKVYTFLAAHPPLELPYSGTEEDALQEARHTAYLVSVASRYGPYHATCLRQSLLLWWLLRRRHILSELRIGVQQREGKFYAHAWVRHGEVVLSESSQVESNFSAFEGLPLE